MSMLCVYEESMQKLNEQCKWVSSSVYPTSSPIKRAYNGIYLYIAAWIIKRYVNSSSTVNGI